MKIVKTYEGYSKAGKYVFTKDDLFTALSMGDSIKIKEIIDQRPDLINSIYKDDTPLSYSCQSNSLDVPEFIEYLLKMGANPNIRVLLPPIHSAATRKDGVILKLLLKYKADPNFLSDYGSTALSYAAYLGNNDNIKTLLDAGADINLRSTTEKTCIFDAIEQKKYDTVLFLIIKGADIYLEDGWGNTAAAKMNRIPIMFQYDFQKQILINRPELFDFIKPAARDDIKQEFRELFIGYDLNLL